MVKLINRFKKNKSLFRVILVPFMVILLSMGLSTSPVLASDYTTFSGQLGTGSSGTSDSTFAYPHDVVTAGGKIFVSDYFNHRIQIFSQSGTYLSTLGETGVPDVDNSHFYYPKGLAVNDTHIFIVDAFNDRVQIFDLDGNYAATLGYSGQGDYGFASPSSVAVNDSHIFVADDGNHRIQIYDSSGTYLQTIGTTGVAGPTTDGQFYAPQDIALNGTHILVVDLGRRIQVFNTDGSWAATIFENPILGSGNDAFYDPRNIVFSTNPSVIFVSDSYNHRVQIFSHNGAYLDTIGTSGTVGTGPGLFNDAEGMYGNGTHLFVVDSRNHRVQIFKLSKTVFITISETITETNTVTETSTEISTETETSTETSTETETLTETDTTTETSTEFEVSTEIAILTETTTEAGEITTVVETQEVVTGTTVYTEFTGTTVQTEQKSELVFPVSIFFGLILVFPILIRRVRQD